MNENNFGSYILRNIVLPDILEDDTSEILYWSGKKLFTHFLNDITDEEQLIAFFNKSEFGDLACKKSTKTKYEFILSGDIIRTRLQSNKPEFSLETGFLSEYIQTITNSYCLSEITLKSKEVIITIAVDHKSNIK